MEHQGTVAAPLKVLRFKQLQERVGYSRMHVDRLEKGGQFPRRVKLGPRSVAWVESEVDEWLRAKAGERNATSPNSATAKV